MKLLRMAFVLFIVSLHWSSRSTAELGEIVPFPEGFRQWTHIRSGFIGPSSPLYERFGGIHHIYGNSKALEGLDSGYFEDGAVFVADFLEMSLRDRDMEMRPEGPRRFVDVMHKDRKRFADTGGWGFEEFLGNSRSERVLDEVSRGQCVSCHEGRYEHDFVFSTFRE